MRRGSIGLLAQHSCEVRMRNLSLSSTHQLPFHGGAICAITIDIDNSVLYVAVDQNGLEITIWRSTLDEILVSSECLSNIED
jgi:hypothetical protein